MDIRNWPMDRIMQLPDNCFGRRFLVSCSIQAAEGATGWDISELGLPEACVIWEFNFWTDLATTEIESMRLALGDQLPTAAAMMDALEPLFPGLGMQGSEPRFIITPVYSGISIRRLRQPILARGRRLVLEVTAVAAKVPKVTVAIVVSSLPTEVPDCLLSARV